MADDKRFLWAYSSSTRVINSDSVSAVCGTAAKEPDDDCSSIDLCLLQSDMEYAAYRLDATAECDSDCDWCRGWCHLSFLTSGFLWKFYNRLDIDLTMVSGIETSKTRAVIPGLKCYELSTHEIMQSDCHANLHMSSNTQSRKGRWLLHLIYQQFVSRDNIDRHNDDGLVYRPDVILQMSFSDSHEENITQWCTAYAAEIVKPCSMQPFLLKTWLEHFVDISSYASSEIFFMGKLKRKLHNCLAVKSDKYFERYSVTTLQLKWLEKTHAQRLIPRPQIRCNTKRSLLVVYTRARAVKLMKMQDVRQITYLMNLMQVRGRKALAKKSVEKENAAAMDTWFEYNFGRLSEISSGYGEVNVLPESRPNDAHEQSTCDKEKISRHHISFDPRSSIAQHSHHLASSKTPGASKLAFEPSFWRGTPAAEISLESMDVQRRRRIAKRSSELYTLLMYPHVRSIAGQKEWLPSCEQPRLPVFCCFSHDDDHRRAKSRQQEVCWYVFSQSKVMPNICTFVRRLRNRLMMLNLPLASGYCERLFSIDVCATKSTERSWLSTFEEIKDVISVKMEHKVSSSSFPHGPNSNWSMDNAYCDFRHEMSADMMSIEVDDHGLFQEYSFAAHDEKLNNLSAKTILDDEDATLTAVHESCRIPAVKFSEREAEYKSEKRTVPLKEKNDFICSEDERACSLDELKLYATSHRPDRRSADVTAYLANSIYYSSPLQQPACDVPEIKRYVKTLLLASYQTWPQLGKLSALRCSNAGFCRVVRDGRTSATDELGCFCCGCTVSGWAPGVDPFALHYEKCRQHCPFIAGQHSQRIAASKGASFNAVGASLICDEKKSILPACRSSAGTICTAEEPRCSTNGLGPVDFFSVPGIGFSAPNSALGPEQLAKYESYRLGTFADVWAAYDGVVNARELAKNGFHYAGPGDRVQCAFCQGLLRNWEPGDRADELHAKHFTYCRFVQGHDVGNVPIPFETLKTNRSTDGKSSMDSTDGQQSELGISCAAPKNSDFAVEARRLLTFATWPTKHHIQPEPLASAGFFYIGKEDAVRCFFCDGMVVDWRAPCDPWVEHAQRFPNCSFLMQVKGRDFVQRHSASGMQSASGSTSNANLAVDPREVRARIDSNKVRILLHMDYPLDLVREVIRNRLATLGDDHETSEQLLADLYRTHDEKQRENAAQNASACRLTSVADPKFSCHPQWVAGSMQDQSSELIAAVAMTHCAVAASAPTVLSPSGRADEQSLRPTRERLPLVALIPADEENRQLKTQLTCKICMDDVVGIVFLPCGHLVCCAMCAPALSYCPICRVSIRATVRTLTSPS